MDTKHSILERSVDSIFSVELPEGFPKALLLPHIATYAVRYHLLPSRIMGETELADEEIIKFVRCNLLPVPLDTPEGALSAIKLFHNLVSQRLNDCFSHIWMADGVEWDIRYVNFTIDRSGLVVVLKRTPQC